MNLFRKKLRQRPRVRRGPIRASLECLESRRLLADGIAPAPGIPLVAKLDHPLTRVTVARYTITDPAGAPGTKWRAIIEWGDGQTSSFVAPVGAGRAFRFQGTHTYTAAGRFSIKVMIAVPGSMRPDDNTVTTPVTVLAPVIRKPPHAR